VIDIRITRRSAVTHVLLIVAAITVGGTVSPRGMASQSPGIPAGQDPPPLRSGVTLVLVNVRVTDARGEPVVDLKPADFRLSENGVPQVIAHVTTQDRRVQETGAPPRQFVIVLGRGSLNTPARGIDAVTEMVRLKLGDRDCVSVMAYFRLTGCTTDRAGVVRWLERARGAHSSIESLMRRDEARQAGAPGMPLQADTMAAIETLFAGSDMPPILALPGSGGGRAAQFWEYPYLRRTIAYLRYLEGEKHIVLLSGRGLTGFGPQLLQEAAAARTTLSIIQTGGVHNEAAPLPPRLGGALGMPPFGWGIGDVFTPGDAANAAVETGGLSIFNGDPTEALARLDRVTRYEYTLGYYPSTPPVAGEFRRIRVEVNRPKATLAYRHGFEAQPDARAIPEPRMLFAELRLKEVIESLPQRTLPAPGGSARRFWDGVHATAAYSSPTPGAPTVDVDVSLDPSGVTFTHEGGTAVANLNLMVIARDRNHRPIGQTATRLEIAHRTADHQQVMRAGIHRTLSVRVAQRPWEVAVAVYEFSSDRAAAAIVRVK